MTILEQLAELEKLKKNIQSGLLKEKERLEAELATVIGAIKEHGISVETKPKKSRRPRSKNSNDDILKFITEEKTAKDLVEGLGLGYQTAIRRLKTLVKEKLAFVAKLDGLKIYYKKK